MKARKVVTRSGKKLRGKFPSAKLGEMVEWESLYERDAFLHLECHPLVLSFQEQPSVEIYYDAMGEPHEYYPDLSARLYDQDELFIEVKPKEFLKRRDVRAKLDAVAARFEEQGRQFRIWTEDDIRREPLFTNLKTLYRSVKRASHRESDEELARSLVGGPKWAFADLVERLRSSQKVLRLIRAGYLRADLEAKLLDDSTVWLANTEGEGNGAFRL